MSRKIKPYTLIEALLVFLPGKFTKKNIHSKLEELRKEYRYLLKDFEFLNFPDRVPYPYSRSLDKILDKLEKAGFLESAASKNKGNGSEEYRINTASIKKIRSKIMLHKFTAGQRKELKEMASKLNNLIKSKGRNLG